MSPLFQTTCIIIYGIPMRESPVKRLTLLKCFSADASADKISDRASRKFRGASGKSESRDSRDRRALQFPAGATRMAERTWQGKECMQPSAPTVIKVQTEM